MSGNNNTPRLRFPEFKEEWKEKKLGEILDYEQPTPYLVSSDSYQKQGTPVLTAGKTFVLGFTDENFGIYDKVPVIIFDDFVTESKYVTFPFKAKSSAMKMLSLKNKSDNLFFAYVSMLLNQKPIGDHKRHWISETSLINIFVPPTSEEQQKIASCLTEMDNLIAAQGQKVEALKEKKKGLMQQLFPQNGESTPRLRFPEFNGEWEEKKLRDVAIKKNTRNRSLEVSRVLTNSATVGIVDQSDYFDRDIAVKNNTDNYHIVELEDFVYNPRISASAPVGPISINKIGKGIMSPLYTIFRIKKGNTSFFEQYFLTNIWHSYLKGIANFGVRFDRMNITSDDFFNMPLIIPTLSEQQTIASFLSEFDNLISSESNKLENLKNYKKGLMQQLFPQPVK